MFFKSDRPVCNHLNVNFIKKTTLKSIFSLKNVFLHFTPQKLLSKRKLFENTATRWPIKMHMYRQKNYFNFISVSSEIMSLKSDRLELGFSITLVFALIP